MNERALTRYELSEALGLSLRRIREVIKPSNRVGNSPRYRLSDAKRQLADQRMYRGHGEGNIFETGGNFYARFMVDGQRKCIPMKSKTRAEAEQEIETLNPRKRQALLDRLGLEYVEPMLLKRGSVPSPAFDDDSAWNDKNILEDIEIALEMAKAGNSKALQFFRKVTCVESLLLSSGGVQHEHTVPRPNATPAEVKEWTELQELARAAVQSLGG